MIFQRIIHGVDELFDRKIQTLTSSTKKKQKKNKKKKTKKPKQLWNKNSLFKDT